MRLRRQPEVKQKLKQYPDLLPADPMQLAGKWRLAMIANAPLILEIGMGRGAFITTIAMQNPQQNYIGMDFREEMIYEGISLLQGKSAFNLKFLWQFADILPDCFSRGEINRIHLNFPDPWPKKRHAKRRLMHQRFLAIYEQILAVDGDLWLKTDQKDLYHYACMVFQENGWPIICATENLHNEKWDNIETEYEKRYVKQGKPIYACRVMHKNCPQYLLEREKEKQEVSLCGILAVEDNVRQ